MSEDYSLGTYSKLAETAEKKQQPPTDTPVAQPRTQNIIDETKQATTIARKHDSVISRKADSTIDSSNDYIEVVRKAVKLLGKEASFHRFTAEEKAAMVDILYALKKKGIDTSENEITRIALNYLVWDHHQNKQASILSRVLERLNA